MKITKKVLLLSLILLLLLQCKLPNFSFKSGGKSNEEIPGKTISVAYFENRAALTSSSASILFTEGLRNIMLAQSKKNLVDTQADWEIEGEIRDYRITPINIQAGTDIAAQNRLTMNVNVVWKYTKEAPEKSNFDTEGNENFSAFVDYNSNLDFATVEEQVLNELIRQLTQDIFDRIFGGKW